MNRIVAILETLGGARPLPASLERHRPVSVALGFYWVGLLWLVIAFSGRGTKFVYIDF
jgi:hypothetical protein